MNTRPILCFDTSAINHLADDEHMESLSFGVKAGFFPRLTETNIEEVIATKDASRRKKLLRLCQRLLAAGDGIKPFQSVTRSLITAFENNPANFQWKIIDETFPALEREIVEQTIIDDKVSSERRALGKENERVFEQIYKKEIRAEFEKLFSESPGKRPESFSDVIATWRLPGGRFWAYGASLYKLAAKLEPEEEKLRRFVDICPPFHAFVLAACIAEYERFTRNLKIGPSLRAGSYDLFMSIYLPYCDVFVTAEDRQYEAFKEITKVGKLDGEIYSYEEFRQRLLFG
jgi:hypothetical protein